MHVTSIGKTSFTPVTGALELVAELTVHRQEIKMLLLGCNKLTPYSNHIVCHL
jgi:hypothetical protein